MLSAQLTTAINNLSDLDLKRKVEYMLSAPTYKSPKASIDVDVAYFDNWYWLCHYHRYAHEQMSAFMEFYAVMIVDYVVAVHWWATFELNRAFLVTRGVKNNDEFMALALENAKATKVITAICDVYRAWVITLLKMMEVAVKLIGILEIRLIKVLDFKFI